MEELDRKIEVMQAYNDGKEIEIKLQGGDWAICICPQWNWSEYDYRIKKEKKYNKRPYKSIDEILSDMKEHGPFIEFSKTVYNQPKAIIMLDGTPIVECETRAYHSVNAKDLMKYNWQDGKGCFVVEKEI